MISFLTVVKTCVYVQIFIWIHYIKYELCRSKVMHQNMTSKRITTRVAAFGHLTDILAMAHKSIPALPPGCTFSCSHEQ